MLSNLFFSLLKINAMATIVAVIVLALKYVLKKCGASRKLLFYLWIIIALRFMYPNFLESNFSLFNIFDTTISEENQIAVNQNNKTDITNTNDFISTNIDLNINNTISNDAVASTEVNDIQTIISNESVVKEHSNKLKITEILMIAWIAGSSCMILYALISYIKLKKTVMFAVKGDGDYYETDMLSTPCVLGIIKPKVYLTLNLTKKEKKYILTHENIHIKRKDYFTKLIAYLILTIHWINPITWILFKLFVNDMEMLCDEESINKLGKDNKVGYMESLVNLSTRNTKNILPCPIAFSENNTGKRVKNIIKYKKSGIIISVVALVICIIIATVCLTNRQEVSNNDDISTSLYEQTEDYLKNEFNRVYSTYYEILDLEISNWNENNNEATFFYTMTFKNYDKDPDAVSYIKEAKGKGDMKSYEIYKKEYLEPKESSYEFKIKIEDNNIELYSNIAPQGEYWEAIMIDEYVPTAISLNEWNNIEGEIVWGKLAYREYQTDKYYTQVIKDKKLLEELNDYLFTHVRKIKGGTACPFDATINLCAANGKRIELELATDSCTVFRIGEQYYEYTEDKREDDSDEVDFYKYFDKIESYINGEKLNVNSVSKEIYINAIKDLYYNYKLPNGNELEDPKYVDDYNMSENQFAIYDVDMDGKDELIIALTHYPMAAMRTIIYDYDNNTNKFREQLTEFTSINFYNNGIIEVLWSHNQGSAGDSLWPYTMYKYNNKTDSYDVIAEVDAWDKSFNENCYIAEIFPAEVDKDGNGILYYIRNRGSDKYIPYDLKEYNEWKEQYITDETQKIIIPYMNFTKENINNLK